MSTGTILDQGRPARVLLVEDNPGDALLTKRAFLDAKIANTLTIAKNGEEAVALLSGEDGVANPTLPDLILLDLNLPKMSGQEVLDFVKSRDTLKHIPVIILSSSKAEQDVTLSYAKHANGYIVKPVDFQSLKKGVGILEQFWFMLVVVPPAPATQ